MQTDKDHLGHGYATLVTKANAKQIAELGCDVYTGTKVTNQASQPLFAKVGFEKLPLKKYWLCTTLNWDAADDANE